MKIKVGDLVKTCFSEAITEVVEVVDIPCVRYNIIEAVFNGVVLTDGRTYREDQIISHWRKS